MSSYKEPSFQERTASANKAKQDALDKLRAKPPVDETILAERREAALLREDKLAKARNEKQAARKLEKAEKRVRPAEDNSALNAVPPSTQEEQKAARDEKYAARKSRSGKR